MPPGRRKLWSQLVCSICSVEESLTNNLCRRLYVIPLANSDCQPVPKPRDASDLLYLYAVQHDPCAVLNAVNHIETLAPLEPSQPLQRDADFSP